MTEIDNSYIRYVDAKNTAVIIKEVESHLVPRYRERVQIDGDIIGRVDAVEWRIEDEKTICIIKLQIDYDDTDKKSLPEEHPKSK